MPKPQFREVARSMLAQSGTEVDEVELAVIDALETHYGPDRERLMAADLSEIAIEIGFDPGSAPVAQRKQDER